MSYSLPGRVANSFFATHLCQDLEGNEEILLPSK